MVDIGTFIIYMITTSLCIIALCIFLIKYIKKTTNILERVEKLENDKGRKRNNN